jgi:hypothetical protein
MQQRHGSMLCAFTGKSSQSNSSSSSSSSSSSGGQAATACLVVMACRATQQRDRLGMHNIAEMTTTKSHEWD